MPLKGPGRSFTMGTFKIGRKIERINIDGKQTRVYQRRLEELKKILERVRAEEQPG